MIKLTSRSLTYVLRLCQKVRCAANKIRVKKFLHSFIIGERESVESICRNVSSAANKIRMKKFLYFFIIGERERERELRVFVDFKFRRADKTV